MRWVIVVLLLCLAGSPARADGFYFTEGVGGTEVKDDLAAYMDSAVRIRIAVGMRKRNLAVEAWLAGAMNTDLHAAGPSRAPNYDYRYQEPVNLTTYGLDLKLVEPVAEHVELYLRGGASGMRADGQLDGYGGRGLGIGAGVQLKGKVRALGFLFWPLFFTQFGPKVTAALSIDADHELYRLHGWGPTIDARLNHITLGFAIGSDF